MSAQILHHKDEYISTSSSKTQGETIPCMLKLEAEYGELIISLHQPPSINNQHQTSLLYFSIYLVFM